MLTTLGLPQRVGDRPTTNPATPHTQLDQTAPVRLQRDLWARMTGLDSVMVGPSGVSVPSTKALHLAPALARGPATAFLSGTEFAHLHGPHDGGLHATLPFPEALGAIDKGWAEYHPMARDGRLPKSLVMIYGPRDRDELQVVWNLVELSYRYARGEVA